MTRANRPSTGAFIRLFNDIAGHRHRYEVFRDFVTLAAISMHNAVSPNERLEAEYLALIGRYPKEDAQAFPKLLAELVHLLDVEPYDALGQLYMTLELGSSHTGQFFTPPELSELMARLAYGDVLSKLDKPFVTVQEPACGAGGMILAFAKEMISAGHNPAERMWAHCQDVDRTAALMCYLQLSLWNIPAVVVVGNTLMLEAREVFYTPAHHLGLWDHRLRRRREAIEEAAPSTPVEETTPEVATPPEPKKTPLAPTAQGQFDFGF